MKNKAICIIPARGGSKRIPKKNIKLFCGKPLISYSIQTAKKTNLFDKIIVNTDSDEIAQVALKYGAEIQDRPKELSDDFAHSGAVVKYAIDRLQKEGLEFEYVCVVYATAPMLQEKYLIEGFETLKNSNACGSFGVASMPFPIQRCFKIKNNRCEMFTPEFFLSRSQDLEEAYQDAGAFYWRKIGCKSDDVFFGKDTIPIVLPRYLVQDIDTMEDFEMAQYMYEAYMARKTND